MDAPQIIYLGLCLLSVISALVLHGKERTKKTWDFYETGCNVLISLGLVYWGGFFSH